MKKSEQTRSLKLLNKIDGVYLRSFKWNHVRAIVDLLKKDEADLHHVEWFNGFRDGVNMTDIKTWSTYEECVQIKCEYFEDKFIAHIRIYDGEMLDGRRQNVRFDAKVRLPFHYIEMIEEDIEYKVDFIAEQAYEDHLRNQQSEWIAKKKFEILNVK